MFRLSLVLVTVLSFFASSVDAGISKWLPKRHKAAPVSAAQKKERARVEKDVQRLESILANVRTTTAKLSAKSLKVAANEATDLADRIYANVKSVTADKNAVQKAEQLRTHVQNMKKEAYNGDQKKTRQHANRALSVATQLDEWAG